LNIVLPLVGSTIVNKQVSLDPLMQVVWKCEKNSREIRTMTTLYLCLISSVPWESGEKLQFGMDTKSLACIRMKGIEGR
jgi:hypothetical protein